MINMNKNITVLKKNVDCIYVRGYIDRRKRRSGMEENKKTEKIPMDDEKAMQKFKLKIG